MTLTETTTEQIFRGILLEEHIRLRCSGALNAESVRFIVENAEESNFYESACWTIYKGKEIIRMGVGIADVENDEYIRSIFRHECAHSRYSSVLHRGRELKDIMDELKRFHSAAPKLFNLFEDARVENLWRNEFDEPFNWLDISTQRAPSTIDSPEKLFFTRYFTESEDAFYRVMNNTHVKLSLDKADFVLKFHDEVLKVHYFHEMTELIKDWIRQFDIVNFMESNEPLRFDSTGESGQSNSESTDSSSSVSEDSSPESNKQVEPIEKKITSEDRAKRMAEDLKDKTHYDPRMVSFEFDVSMEEEIRSGVLAEDETDKLLIVPNTTMNINEFAGVIEGHKSFFIGGEPLTAEDIVNAKRDAERLKKYMRGGEEKIHSITPKKRFSVRRYVRKDTKIYKSKEEVSAASANIIMFVDCSGSMYGYPIYYGKYLINVLNHIAKDMNFKVKVILSRSGGALGDDGNYCYYGTVNLPAEEKYLINLGKVGCTEALHKNMKKFEKEMLAADYVMVYTDGDLADTPIDKEALNKKGIYTIGLLVKDDWSTDYLKDWFDTVLVRSSIKELMDSLAIVFKKKLLKNKI